MPTINQLNSIDSPSGSDLLALYSQVNGDARKLSLSNLLTFIKANFASPQFVSQFATPQNSGFSVSVTNGSDNIWLILNPAAGYAAGTIILPASDNAIDGQEVLVVCSRQVNALAIDGNGALEVRGAPTSLGADDFFRLRYQVQARTWYRVG